MKNIKCTVNTTNWNYHDIKAVHEDVARNLAVSVEVIKGHTVYFVDFGGYFGYSCLVFKDGRHLYYANDYALHHPEKSICELHAIYMQELNNVLFEEFEMSQPLADYGEFVRKDRYLRNIYGQMRDSVFIFLIGKDEYQKDKNRMVFDPISYAYYWDADFVRWHKLLHNNLRDAFIATKNDAEFWKGAFYNEMCNHEYGINSQADYDVLGTFGNIQYEECGGLQSYFDQLNLTDAQKMAYFEAKKQYYIDAMEKQWF